MPAYQLAWYGWIGLAVAALLVQRPLYAIFPTCYLPILAAILFRKFGNLSYADIHAMHPHFGRKLNIANLVFVVVNGVILGQIDGKDHDAF